MALVHGCLGDEAVREKVVRPVEGVLRDGSSRFRGGDRSARAVLGQLQILFVEPRDPLARRDAVTGVDEAFHDLSGHAEAELTLDARCDHAGVSKGPLRLRRRDHVCLNGPNRLLRRLRLITCSESQRSEQDRHNTEK